MKVRCLCQRLQELVNNHHRVVVAQVRLHVPQLCATLSRFIGRFEMRVTFAVFVSAILIFFAESGSAQQQWHVDFRGVPLTLGESRTSAVLRLQARFQLRPVGDDSSFLVLAPEPDEPFHSVGTVVFSRGRLSFVSRSWPTGGDPNALASAVTRALSQLANHGGCTVRAWADQAPEADTHRVIVSCSGHEILITSGNIQGIPVIGVSESWYVR